MGSKSFGYILGGLQIAVGAILTITGIGASIGVPLMISGAATVAGTALTPSPPRAKNLRDSPTYGIDQFDNPRGPDAFVAILFGTHRVKPVVIAESVSSVAENNAPGVDAQKKQGVKWLGAVCEGEVADIRDIEINDRKALSDLIEAKELGKGNGTKKTFDFPARWVYLGGDETPAVDVFVDGVRKSYSTKSATAEFTVPTPPTQKYDSLTGLPLPIPKLTFDLKRDDRRERILEGSLRVYIRGTGHPEAEQARRVGAYKWGVVKLAAWKVRLKFQTRPPTGFTVKVTYDYLGSEGLALTQDGKGNTKAVFGTAPANGKKVTATYRTTPFPGLKIRWRTGTLDQSVIEGFTDLEQGYTPRATLMEQNGALEYSTGAREVDDLRVTFAAPRGFIQYKDDGGTNPVSAKVRIEYRKVGAASWITLRNESGTEFKLVAERSSTVRWQVGLRSEWQRLFDSGDNDAGDKLEAFDRAAYEVRVTRLDKPSTDSLVADELHFQTVVEVLREGFTYPGTCLLALEAMPSEFLSGGSLRVSCVATRGKLYDPRTDAHYGRRDLGSSQNAALALRDLVTSAEGKARERYGGGFFFTGADLFVGTDGFTGTPPNESPAASRDSFLAFSDFCDEWVHRPGDDPTKPPYSATYASAPPYSTTNGERRCRLNLVLDTPQSLMEAVSDLAFLGYCFATLQGVKWRFPLDQDGDPVFTFVDDVDPPNQNMGKFVLNLEGWSKTPTHVQGSFWSEFLDYERDELLFPVEDLPEGRPLNIREVNLAGCTRESEAARALRHLAEQAKRHPFPCSWEAHPGSQFVEAGDIVTVKTRIPYSTGSKALELKVRVLACLVSRDEEGRLAVRYAGRVMSGAPYNLQPVTVPANATPAQTTAQTGSGIFGLPVASGTGLTASGKRLVTNLRARVG
ncbi:MAG: hypothetical protein HUU06_00285 [Planctomycetaceae bacterium]|nr:hypothetical protein [Planctomycetota bacterium]NUN51213.1 hypothetical protein [Planctomycetaceae bacterium]